MKQEYDLAAMKGGVRGKYHRAYLAGHSVRINKVDCSVEVKNYTIEDGLSFLRPMFSVISLILIR